MADQWYAGSNEEWFNLGPFDSRDEAIAEARNNWPERHFFIGKSGEYKPFCRDFVDELLELEACDVSDECGSDAGDNWPPSRRSLGEKADEVNGKIRAMLVELCGDCSVFPITDSERIEPEIAS